MGFTMTTKPTLVVGIIEYTLLFPQPQAYGYEGENRQVYIYNIL